MNINFNLEYGSKTSLRSGMFQENKSPIKDIQPNGNQKKLPMGSQIKDKIMCDSSIYRKKGEIALNCKSP